MTLDVSGLTAALEARAKKEVELNALPIERKVTRTLQRVTIQTTETHLASVSNRWMNRAN